MPTIPAGYPTHTPWGAPDYFREIAPGIASYSTPGHGGIWLSPERRAAMPAPLRDFPPFGGNAGWYEEDEDWRIPYLAFPEECVAADDPHGALNLQRAKEHTRYAAKTDWCRDAWKPVAAWLETQ
jgi:hypothetical protein